MDPKTIRAYGQIAVSTFSMLLLVGCLIMAYKTGDKPSIEMIVGAILGYAAASVHFYLGDSSGGQTKDDIIASSTPVPLAPTDEQRLRQVNPNAPH